MSRNRRRVPKYRHYKPKNLGVVRIEGKDHYLGKYQSPKSLEEYHRLIAELLQKRHHLAQADGSPGNGDCSYSLAAFTIARMPAWTASGSVGQVSITAATG